jgi:transposase-like protein
LPKHGLVRRPGKLVQVAGCAFKITDQLDDLRLIGGRRRLLLLDTTNAIEALNSKLRRAVRTRGHFPTDEAALKLLFLVLNRTEKEWAMPAREWNTAKAQFAIQFGEPFTQAMMR